MKTKKIPITLMVFLMTLMVAGVSLAQDETPAPDAAATGGESLIGYTPESDTELLAEATTNQTKLSVSFKEASLDSVVEMFTKIADANIIVSASNLYDKTVTVNLKDVEWKPALSSILDTHGLMLSEQSPGVYTIIEKTEDVVHMTTRSFKLNYTTVGDLAPVIQSMLPADPPGASLTQFPQRNILVIKTTADNLTEIESIIKEIDKPSQQVCIETKFMELNDTASKQLGIKWTSLEQFTARLGAGPFTRTENVTRDTTRTGASSQWDSRRQTDAYHTSYDQTGAAIDDTGSSLTQPLGGNLIDTPTAMDSSPTRSIQDSVDKGKEVTSDLVDGYTKSIEETQAAILELDTMQLILSALERTDGVSVVSNPKLIVTSGYTNAVFLVGQAEPLIKTEISRGTADSPGDIVTASLDTSVNMGPISGGFVHTGIELRVIPTVKTDDMIEAVIIPALTRTTGNKSVGQNSWPIMSVKSITTKFTLRSGQTVAIGGLTDTRETKEKSQIPLLGNIPLIGKYLFSHTKDVKEQIETIIFVTLSLADPKDIDDNVGMPENADLAYRRQLRDRARRHQSLLERERLREETEAQIEKDSTRVNARIYKRDR